MKEAGDIVEKPQRFRGKTQVRTVAQRLAAKELFTEGEIDLIHETVSRFWQMSATEISNESHTFLGWKLAQMGETIPYNTALIGARRPTDKERKLGRRLLKLARESLAGRA